MFRHKYETETQLVLFLPTRVLQRVSPAKPILLMMSSDNFVVVLYLLRLMDFLQSIQN